MDNYYQQCPPMMSDGRLFTDYRSAVRREETNKFLNGFVRDDEYRLFLQNNAKKIMNRTYELDKATKSCWPNECVHNYPTRVYPPWFVQERKNYDELALPQSLRTKRFPCEKFTDYRLARLS